MNDHVEGLERESSPLALGMVDDAHRRPDALAVSQREEGDHRTPCQVELVVERAAESLVLVPERDSGRRSSGGVGAGVAQQGVMRGRGHEPVAACRLERLERRQHDRAVGIDERGGDGRDPLVPPQQRLQRERATTGTAAPARPPS